MSTTVTSGQKVALSEIHSPTNVRALDEEHVQALAGSIRLQGVIVPVVVRERPEGGFEVVAGFHRVAAARSLGLGEVPVVIRDAESEEADRAVENITRKQLNAYEEARAVRAMLDRGLTEDGAAQALGWPKARVTARVKLLELPERAQEMVGAGVLALSCVDQLRAIGTVAPALLDAVIAWLDDGNEWAAERLARQPGWVIDSALRATEAKVFAAHLTAVGADVITDLRLGKKTDALYAEVVELQKKLDPHAYYAPTVPFTEDDVDRARAGGAVIEFENSRPIVVDRSVYRELCKAAIARTAGELRDRAEQAAAEKRERRQRPAEDPAVAARGERDSALREIADRAHGANLDLGTALMRELAVVDPASLDVARFFVYALLGPEPSGNGQAGEHVRRVAACGVRLVIEEHRTDVTKTRKDGTRGRTRYDYGDHRGPEAALRWLWRFLDGAKTAGELYGRALVVIVAEQYASRLVVPGSQRENPVLWGSRQDRAAKALKKLAGSHVPASLKEIERAVARAHAAHDQQTAPGDALAGESAEE